MGRLDLAPVAEPGFEPMPTRLSLHAGALWVGLAHLRADFSAAGPGRIARIPAPPSDGDAREVVDWLANADVRAIELPELENCVEVAPAAGGVWVVCAGSFRRGTVGQAAKSGLAFVAADGTVETAVGALALSDEPGGAPLGFTLAAVDAHRAVVVLLGDLVSERPDRAVLVTRADPSGPDAGAPPTVQILAETRPFALGDALVLGDGETVILCDGDATRPALIRVPLGDPTAATRIDDTSGTGLPPRAVRRFRIAR